MNSPILNPHWLRSFVAVAQNLSFTQAADALGTQQSTVSAHVRKLEKSCGVRLFVRDTHSVRLTGDGEAMVGFATTILETHHRAVTHFARGALKGRVRLGVSDDVVLAGLPQVLRRFTADNPRVTIELKVGLSEPLRADYEKGDIDIAFIKRRRTDAPEDVIWRDPVIWIAAEDFVFDPSVPLPIILVAPPAITRKAILEALKGSGTPWHCVCTSESMAGIHAAVAAGLGVAAHAKSLAPLGAKQIQHELLPDLGDVEFILLARQGGRRDPVPALSQTIKANASLMRRPR